MPDWREHFRFLRFISYMIPIYQPNLSTILLKLAKCQMHFSLFSIIACPLPHRVMLSLTNHIISLPLVFFKLVGIGYSPHLSYILVVLHLMKDLIQYSCLTFFFFFFFFLLASNSFLSISPAVCTD